MPAGRAGALPPLLLLLLALPGPGPAGECWGGHRGPTREGGREGGEGRRGRSPHPQVPAPTPQSRAGGTEVEQ